VVVNEDFDACYEEVRQILTAERLKRVRQTGLIPFVRELMKDEDEG
jgi:guanylate kinase